MIREMHFTRGTGSETAVRPSTGEPGRGPDFHSLLQGKLEGFQPLERMIIEILSRTLDSLLAQKHFMGGETFLAPPLFIPPKENIGEQARDFFSEFDIAPAPSGNLHQKPDFDPIVKAAGEKYGVDPALIRAVIQTESSGNPQAVSRVGAQGLMQLMPKTAVELGVRDPFDPSQNIMGGTSYLRKLLDRYQGDRKLALAAYNWGMGNVENRLEAMPRETRDYLLKVESLYQKFSTA
jgi:soluble lytic murein transglycosylase-like protein